MIALLNCLKAPIRAMSNRSADRDKWNNRSRNLCSSCALALLLEKVPWQPFLVPLQPLLVLAQPLLVAYFACSYLCSYVLQPLLVALQPLLLLPLQGVREKGSRLKANKRGKRGKRRGKRRRINLHHSSSNKYLVYPSLLLLVNKIRTMFF